MKRITFVVLLLNCSPVPSWADESARPFENVAKLADLDECERDLDASIATTRRLVKVIEDNDGPPTRTVWFAAGVALGAVVAFAAAKAAQ
jgi:hypothetical protein